MANPPTAKAFPQALDPHDEEVCWAYVSQGRADQTPPPILMMGEGVASYALGLRPEAATAGLRIMSGVGADRIDRTDRLVGNELQLWFDVVPELRGSSLFDGEGVTVGVEITIRTTLGRKKQHTLLVRIANQ